MRRRVPALVLLAALLAAVPASAQEGPRRLFPDRPSAPSTAAPDILPGPGAAPGTGETRAGEGRGGAPGGGIKVETLPPPGPAQAGLVAAEDPLGPNPWRGIDPALMRELIAAMPSPTALTAPLHLQERLLLAPLPAGVGDEGLLEARVARLIELGRPAEARRLVQQAPPSAASGSAGMSELDRLALRAALLDGDATPCARLPEAAGLELRLVCAVARESGAEADLLLRLAEDAGTALDPMEKQLAQRAAGARPTDKVLDLAKLGDQALPMLAHVPLEVSEKAVADAPPSVQAMLARNAQLPAAARLAAAEAAARAGHLTVDTFREVLKALPERLPDSPAGRRARLARAALTGTVPAERAQAVQALWRQELDGALRVAYARAVAPAVQALESQPELLGMAPAAVAALLLEGDTRGARRWLLLAQLRAEQDPEAPALASRLAPLLRLAGVAEAAATQVERPSGEAGLTFDALAQALALPGVEPDWLRRVLTAGEGGAAAKRATAPALAVWRGLEAAAQARRTGATAFMALRLLEERSEPASLLESSEAVQALRTAGMERDAQRLAVAVAVARGLAAPP